MCVRPPLTLKPRWVSVSSSWPTHRKKWVPCSAYSTITRTPLPSPWWGTTVYQLLSLDASRLSSQHVWREICTHSSVWMEYSRIVGETKLCENGNGYWIRILWLLTILWNTKLWKIVLINSNITKSVTCHNTCLIGVRLNLAIVCKEHC